MTTLKHSCPECLRRFSYPDKRAGDRVKCPACKNPIKLPNAGLPSLPTKTSSVTHRADQPKVEPHVGYKPTILSDSKYGLVILACIASPITFLITGMLLVIPSPDPFGWPINLLCFVSCLASGVLLVWSWTLYFLHNSALKQEQIRQFKLAIEKFQNNPESVSTQNQLVELATKNISFRNQTYVESLAAVETTDGSNKCKQFAVLTGRLHYGGRRANGLPTVYDEAAIRNDISARTGDM